MLELNPEAAETTARACSPEAVRKHYVEMQGRQFPIKQLFDETLKTKVYKANELTRFDFTTLDARLIRERLEFKCMAI